MTERMTTSSFNIGILFDAKVTVSHKENIDEESIKTKIRENFQIGSKVISIDGYKYTNDSGEGLVEHFVSEHPTGMKITSRNDYSFEGSFFKWIRDDGDPVSDKYKGRLVKTIADAMLKGLKSDFKKGTKETVIDGVTYLGTWRSH